MPPLKGSHICVCNMPDTPIDQIALIAIMYPHNNTEMVSDDADTR